MLQRILKKGSIWALIWESLDKNPVFEFLFTFANDLFWMLLGIKSIGKGEIVIFWAKGLYATILYAAFNMVE